MDRKSLRDNNITPRVLDSMIPRGPVNSRSSVPTPPGEGLATDSPLPLRSGRDSIGSTCSATPDNSASSAEDAVRVFVRIRPLLNRESDSSTSTRNAAPKHSIGPVVSAVGDNTVVLADPAKLDTYAVTVDQVLDADASQEAMFAAAGERMVQHSLAGLNTSIFAYGQTGSGKTYTMLGDVTRMPDGRLSPECGLIPRVFESLFAAIAEREQTHRRDAGSLRYSVKCSFLEIYNEEVTDLLNPSSTGLQIRDGDLKKGVYVQGLSETEVLNADDVLHLVAAGSENRRIATTNMNDRSSRSHSVFTATIESHERTPSGVLHVRFAKMNLIDLAGSERVGRSGAAGQQLTEAKAINRSLAVLSRVISALVERQRRPSVHVPYRDSRLTFLLQESLGGNSRTCIVANVTPAADSANETYSTLNFANGAKKIRCKATVNEDRTGDSRALAVENVRLETLVSELQMQLEQAQALFDQNNTAITSMGAEHAVLKRELMESKATAARLSAEAGQLRTENAMLGAAVEKEEAERDRLLEELRIAREAATREAENSRKTAEELAILREDLGAARTSAALAAAEAAEARNARNAAETGLEEAREEIRRVQREAKEESMAAAAREQDLRRALDEFKVKHLEASAEADRLRRDLTGEHTSVTRYKRMVGEIGRLIDWAQASGVHPPALLPPGAPVTRLNSAYMPNSVSRHAKPSPAALAALRVARMSLGVGSGSPGSNSSSPTIAAAGSGPFAATAGGGCGTKAHLASGPATASKAQPHRSDTAAAENQAPRPVSA